MFSAKKALLSAALCAALTAPSQASYNPDEGTSTNSNTLTMLSPQNVERVATKNGLLEELAGVDDKVKALALAAHAPEIFPEGMQGDMMQGDIQAWIIDHAFTSSRPLSEYTALGAACKEHLFTEGMDGADRGCIILHALRSSRPVSEYAALGAACREHLFTKKMEDFLKTEIITFVLPLSDTQLAQLVRECGARPRDELSVIRRLFIYERIEELLESK